MTKTAKNRWGKKRVLIEVPPTFNDEQTEKLAALLGVSRPKCVTTLQKRLNSVALDYRLFVKEDSWERPSEIRAALDDIHQLACKLSFRMIDLPDRTQIDLESSYSLACFDYEEDFADGHIKLERDIKHLERLVSSIVHARQNVPKDKGGRPHQHNLDVLARMLGGIYQNFTGKPFRAPLSIKAGMELPGKFVRQTIHIVDPEAKASAVNTAMKRAARSLKEAPKTRPSSGRRARRNETGA